MGTIMDHRGASSNVNVHVSEIICECIIGIALLHNFIILIYHICKTTLFIKQDDSFTKLSRVIFISILSIFLMVLSNITNILSTFSLIPTQFINCRWQINIQLFAYIYSKICLYILFLERLFSVFTKSDLSFNKPSKIISRLYLILLLSFYTTMIIIYSNGSYSPNLNGCVFNHPFWLNIIAASMDFGTILTILILFSRRLWTLSHRITDDIQSNVITMHRHSGTHTHNINIPSTTISSTISTRHTPVPNIMSHGENSNTDSRTVTVSEQGQTPTPGQTTNRLPLQAIESNSISSVHHVVQMSIQSLANISNRISAHSPNITMDLNAFKMDLAKWNADDELLTVLRKTTILNIIAVISTLFSMILCCFIFPTLWISIDSMVNSWSILLMFKWYNDIYLFCCDKVSNKLSDECLSCCSCHCFCSVITSNYSDNDSNNHEMNVMTHSENMERNNNGIEMMEMEVNNMNNMNVVDSYSHTPIIEDVDEDVMENDTDLIR